MSNLYSKLPVIAVKNPLLDFVPPSVIAVGPANNKSFNISQTQTFSQSSINAKLEISNVDMIIDRNLILDMPINVEVIGTTSTGQNILLDGCWAFRSNPVAKAINVMNVQYGNSSYAFNSADCVSALEHYQLFPKDKYTSDFQPLMLDAYCEYDQGYGAIRNPLNLYSSNSDNVMSRGTQPIWGVGANPYSPQLGTPVVNTPTRAYFQTNLQSCLLASPLLDKLANHGPASYGLSKLNNLTIDLTLVSNLGARLLSFMKNRGADVLTITAINVTVLQPVFRFVQVHDVLSLPPVISYNLNTIERYFTDAVLPLGVPTQIDSQVIQISRIPAYAMVVARPNNNILNGGTATYHGSQIADSFASIVRISCDFNGRTLLTNSDPSQLYKIAVQNSCVDSYQQFSGIPLVGTYNGGAPSYIVPTGTVLKLKFNSDLNLEEPGLCTGVNFRSNLQFHTTFINNNTITNNFTMLLILCYDDIIQFYNSNNTFISSSPIEISDVLHARENHTVHSDVLKNHNYAGTGMLSGMSSLVSSGKRNFGYLKAMADLLTLDKPTRDSIKSVLSHGHSDVVKDLQLLGFGDSGGKRAPRSAMRKSLLN